MVSGRTIHTENLILDNECSNPLLEAFPPTETLKTLIPPFMPVSFSIDEAIAEKIKQTQNEQ